MDYSNILELQFDLDEARVARHEVENNEWTSADYSRPASFIKQGPALDAAIARLDEQFKAYSARLNGGR